MDTVTEDPLPGFLKTLKKPHLVIGIQSDGLFTYGEQQLMGDNIPDVVLKKLDSHEGHDAFLLEFEIIDKYSKTYLQEKLVEFYDDSGKVVPFDDWASYVVDEDNGGNSVFGEAEQNITNW